MQDTVAKQNRSREAHVVDKMSSSSSDLVPIQETEGCVYNWCWIHLFRLYHENLWPEEISNFQNIIGHDILALNISEYCNGISGPTHVQKKKLVRWIRNLAVVFLPSKVHSDVQMLFQMLVERESIAMNIAEFFNGTGGPNHLQVRNLAG